MILLKSKEQHWELGIAALTSAGKDEERCRPRSQEASPDTAALDFLRVTGGKSATEKRSGAVTQ